MLRMGLTAAVVILAAVIDPLPAAGFETGRAAEPVLVDGEPILYGIGFAAVMPGEIVRFDTAGGRTLALETPDGTVHRKLGRLSWRAPFEPGHYPLRLTPEGGEPIRLQLFVKVPAWKVREGRLNGYEIGSYPLEPLDGKTIYERPEGFIEVTEDLRWLLVSPHFVLGQFLCKQESDWPKYLLLRPRLLVKLERLLQTVNARGIAARTLHVMSGYRTPAYNERLGNVAYSRHLWGGAADIFIDADPIDFRMDDLNGDGRIDRADASNLFDLAARIGERADVPRLIGGVGEYDATPAHGPFVHVDVRGVEARWGRQRLTAEVAPGSSAAGAETE